MVGGEFTPSKVKEGRHKEENHGQPFLALTSSWSSSSWRIGGGKFDEGAKIESSVASLQLFDGFLVNVSVIFFTVKRAKGVKRNERRPKRRKTHHPGTFSGSSHCRLSTLKTVPNEHPYGRATCSMQT